MMQRFISSMQELRTMLRRWRPRRRSSQPEVVGIRMEDGGIELIVLPRRLAPDESKLRVVHFPEGNAITTEAGWAERVTDEDLEEVLRTPNVIRLHVDQTKISDPMLARILERYSATLEDLSIHTTIIGDEGLAGIDRCERLKSLTAWRTRITDASLRRIAKLPLLKTLIISETAITGPGLRSLRGMSCLEHFAARGGSLPDDLFATFETWPSLRFLTLSKDSVRESSLGTYHQRFPQVTIAFTNGIEDSPDATHET